MGYKLLKDKNKLLLEYKLLNDSLFLVSGFFFLAILAESILPGIITFHFRFYKLLLLLLANLIGIYLLSSFIPEIEEPEEMLPRRRFFSQNKKTFLALLFLSFIVMANLHFKLNFFVSFILVTSLYAVGYFIYKVIFEED